MVPRGILGDENTTLPSFPISLRVNRRPVALRPLSDRAIRSQRPDGGYRLESDLYVDLNFPARGTTVLDVQANLPLGRTGYEGKERIAAYWLAGDSASPYGTLQVAWKYGPNTVFNLPSLSPQGYEVGTTGAFWRATGYRPPSEFTTIRFYPPGLRG